MTKRTIEEIILIILWTGSLITYGIALATGYPLFISDMIGMAGLIIVTIINRINRKVTLDALIILLFIGMLNLASFVYFFNSVVSFGFSGKVLTPGIQLYSLILFWVLALVRRPRLMEKLKKLTGISEENKNKELIGNTNMFRKRFESLTNSEIEKKLKLDLADEARLALLEIQRERASTQNEVENKGPRK